MSPRKDGVYLISGTKRGSQWTYPGLNKKLAAAKEMGAVGALVISPTLESFTENNIKSSKKPALFSTAFLKKITW